jgi:hypothetical protein
MRRLMTHYDGPSFSHWYGQRHVHLFLLTALLLLDVAITYLFIEVRGTGYERNLLIAPLLEMRCGYSVVIGLKLLVAALATSISWSIYKSLHLDRHYRKTKWHIQKLEVWLWLVLIVLAAAVDMAMLADAAV